MFHVHKWSTWELCDDYQMVYRSGEIRNVTVQTRRCSKCGLRVSKRLN